MRTATDQKELLGRVERVSIGALGIDRVALDDIPRILTGFVEEGTAHHVVTVNLQFLGIASKNPAFAWIVSEAGLVVADGMPVVWLSKLLGVSMPGRITGHELVHISARLAAERGYSIAFLGGGPGIAEEAGKRLRSMYPGLKPVGIYQGSFSQNGHGLSERDEAELVASLRSARPDFLFVALGCPKQEFWISRHLHEVGVPVCIGVGCVPDVLAGKLNRAPSWMQHSGLEWSYRLFQEPVRLGKRYLLGDVGTLSKLGIAVLRERSHRAARVSEEKRLDQST